MPKECTTHHICDCKLAEMNNLERHVHRLSEEQRLTLERHHKVCAANDELRRKLQCTCVSQGVEWKNGNRCVTWRMPEGNECPRHGGTLFEGEAKTPPPEASRADREILCDGKKDTP